MCIYHQRQRAAKNVVIRRRTFEEAGLLRSDTGEVDKADTGDEMIKIGYFVSSVSSSA